MDLLEQGFQFEGLQVTPLTGEVSGPGGLRRLDPKIMDVLVLMARHAGQVVSREDLHTRSGGAPSSPMTPSRDISTSSAATSVRLAATSDTGT